MLAIHDGMRRHQPGYYLAVPGDDNFFAGFNPVEQLTQFVFGLEGPDLAPDIAPIDSV